MDSTFQSGSRRRQGSQELQLSTSVIALDEGGHGQPPPAELSAAELGTAKPMSLLQAHGIAGSSFGLQSRNPFQSMGLGGSALSNNFNFLGSLGGAGSQFPGSILAGSSDRALRSHTMTQILSGSAEQSGSPRRRSERVASRSVDEGLPLSDAPPELTRQGTSELPMYTLETARLCNLAASMGGTPRVGGRSFSGLGEALGGGGVTLSPLDPSVASPAAALTPPAAGKGAVPQQQQQHRPAGAGGEVAANRKRTVKGEPDGGKGAKQQKTDTGSGSHVKDRPEMQKKAREGQEYWLDQVKKLRTAWAAHKGCGGNAAFTAQVDACQQLQIKSQHECLLRTLQIASADGLIVASPFSRECDNSASFLGWTGFHVQKPHAAAFKGRVTDLFPPDLKKNTLHTTFRRAGLTPDKWPQGWDGSSPFLYSQEKRQAYAPTRSGGDHKGARG